jgi:hypothetical protein
MVSVAWIDINNQGISNIGYTFSTDDGETFSAPQQIVSPGNRVASDPVLATDAMGNIYVVWVAFRVMGGNPVSMRIYVSIAPAGSTTFGPPIQVSQPMDGGALYDKPWITVTNKGTIFITYERDLNNNELGLVAARSTDGGMTWQRTFIADEMGPTATFRNLAYPCAPRNGNHLWVTYVASAPTSNGVDIRLSRSDDDGLTWQPEVTVSQPNDPTAFEDPTCAGDGENVWVTYGLSKDPIDQMAGSAQKLASIQLVHSGDGGQTFDTRTEAGDPAAMPFFMHPQLVMEETGSLDVVYYAGAKDEDQAGSYRRARAAMPPAFGPSSVVESPLVYLQSRSDPRWLGDYTGLYTRNGKLYTSYVVNTSGTAQVAFAKYLVP